MKPQTVESKDDVAKSPSSEGSTSEAVRDEFLLRQHSTKLKLVEAKSMLMESEEELEKSRCGSEQRTEGSSGG